MGKNEFKMTEDRALRKTIRFNLRSKNKLEEFLNETSYNISYS